MKKTDAIKPDGSIPSERDQRLNQVLAGYLEAVGAGAEPDRDRLLAEHPDLASEVADFLANQDRMKALVAPFRTLQIPVSTATPPVDGSASGGEAPPGTFGPYELLNEIARGGMGIVYRARHRQLHRTVALKKILGADARNSAAVRRFRQEAEAAAQLDHPNIVPIYEVGDVDGQPYFTMKLIDGGGLDQQIKHFTKNHRAAACLMAVVARAVHHAHQRGILHRDLKPANILLASGGREPPVDGAPALSAPSTGGSRPPLAEGIPLVTDFGLAKWLTTSTDAAAQSNLTRTDMVVGTASYMAPEQAQNQPLTTAADVYALGVILFELLTGRTPFLGKTVLDILLQVVEQEPPRLRSLNPRVDADLELICLKCLEKDPAQRFGSAAALAEELEHWSAGEPISVRSIGHVARLRRWCRRNPLPAVLCAALLLCVSIVVLGSPAAAYLIDVERRNTAAANVKFEEQNDTLETTNEQLNTTLGKLQTALTNETSARTDTAKEREKLRQQLVRRCVSDGSRLLDDGDSFGSLVWFTRALWLDQGNPEREEMHRLRVGMVLQRSPKLVQMWFPDKPIVSATFSANGQRVCGVGADGVVRAWTVGKEKAVLQFGDTIRKSAFSRDGARLLAVHEDGKARLWDTATGKTLHEFAHDGVTSATFNANESWAVIAGQDGTARVWDLANLKHAPRQTPRGSGLRFAAVGPHGRVVIAAGDTETVWWQWHDRAKSRAAGFAELKRTPGSVDGAVFGAEDSLILTFHHNAPRHPHPWLLAGQSLEHKPRIDRLVRGDFDLCFGPRKGVVLTTEGAAAQAWDVADRKLVGPRFAHGGDVTYAVCSPDGKRVFTAGADRTARVWDAETGQALTPTLVRPPGVLARARFSPDGRRVLLVTNLQGGATTVEVVEVPTLESAFQKPESRPWGPRALVSPDGALALAASSDQKTVQLWDTKSARPLGSSIRFTNINALSVFSSDSRHMLTSDRGFVHIGRVEERASGKSVAWSAIQPGGEVKQAAFSTDGARVVTLSRRDNQLLLESWDTTTAQAVGPVVKVQRSESKIDKLSPDGRLLVVARPIGAQLDLLDTSTGVSVLTQPLVHNVRVHAVAFSPDGRRLVTACVDRTAQVWNADNGQPVAGLLPLGTSVLAFAFHGAGRLLATVHAKEGSSDKEGGAVRVWDTATWQPVTSLLLHDRVQSVAFGPTGRSVITSAADDSVRVWDLRPTARKPADLVEQAQLLAGREVDENGYLMPRQEAALRDIWPKLRRHLTE